MLPKGFYRTDNISRARYAHIGVGIATALLCGYLCVLTMLDMRTLWDVRGTLGRLKVKTTTLTRQVFIQERRNSGADAARSGGVELFAVEMAKWAQARNISIESVAPEVTPTVSEIKVGDSSLGQWTADKVRVQGHGRFEQVMSLLDEFRYSRMPVQVEAFGLQVIGGKDEASVTFQVLLTVYKKQKGPS